MKQVLYRGNILANGSTALELWQAWQKDTKDRNAAQKKLDSHMKELEQKAKDLMERYPCKLSESAFNDWMRLYLPEWLQKEYLERFYGVE